MHPNHQQLYTQQLQKSFVCCQLQESCQKYWLSMGYLVTSMQICNAAPTHPYWTASIYSTALTAASSSRVFSTLPARLHALLPVQPLCNSSHLIIYNICCQTAQIFTFTFFIFLLPNFNISHNKVIAYLLSLVLSIFRKFNVYQTKNFAC